MSEMFEKAARAKIRFESSKGLLTVEDLWDLPLTSAKSANLDDLAKALYKQVKETAGEISFVKPVEKDGGELQMKFEIVKHIIDVRVSERDAAAAATARREQKQNILALIAQKENEQLAGTSLEDLRKMAESL